MSSRDNEMLDLQNCRILFASPEGNYEGTVCLVCAVAKKMLVSKTFFLPKRIPLGTLSFSFRDILSYEIISKPDASDLKNEESNRTSHLYTPSRVENNMCFTDDYSEVGFGNEDEVYVDDLYEEEQHDLKVPPHLVNRIPMDNVIIDHIDDEFHQAVNHIMKQDSIGVSLEGPRIGRNGILSWICLSTSHCTFLFDIEDLGEKAFKAGLTRILENSNIQKVLHDCRQASDCLFHKFNTKLVNVFDTQVADLLVTLQLSKNCKVSKHVSPLNSCLRNYLEIPEDYLYRSKEFRSHEENVSFSRIRPLQSSYRDILLKNVMYLRLLKRELNFALLTPFYRSVDVYLQVLQNATDRELLLEPSVPEEIPQDLIMDGIQIVRFKEFVDVPPVVFSGPPYRKLNNPIKEYAKYCENNENRQNSNSSQSKISISNVNSSQLIANPSIDELNLLTLHTKNSNLSSPIKNSVNNYNVQNIDSSKLIVATTKVEKSPTKDYRFYVKKYHDECRKPSRPKVSSENADPNVITRTCKEKKKPVEDSVSYMKNNKPVQRNETPETKIESKNLEFLRLMNSTSATSQNPTLGNCEPTLVAGKSCQEILIQLRKSRKSSPSATSISLENVNSAHNLNEFGVDTTDSDRSNPTDSAGDFWAAFKAEPDPCNYSAETVQTKYTFIPAGCAY